MKRKANKPIPKLSLFFLVHFFQHSDKGTLHKACEKIKFGKERDFL